MLKHVDLCSGIGGFALGFKWAGLSKPVLFCDIEPWCRKLLAHNFPNVPIADDVKEIANDPKRFIPEPIGILTAGYPCQPFSAAGKRRGEEDPRHIFPHILRIVAQTRPTFTVFENVYGHISMGLDNVLNGMESEGYTVKPFVVPASGVGARHKRDRVWILGYAEHDGPLAAEVARGSFKAGDTGKEGAHQTSQLEGTGRPEYGENVATGTGAENVGNTEDFGWDGRSEATGRTGAQSKQEQPRPEVRGEPSRPSENVAYTESIGVQGYRPSGEQIAYSHAGQEISLCSGQRNSATQWETEPSLDRVVDGVPNRVDRIKGLGNAIVPQIAMNIGLCIKGMIDES
jgi:DNA (cytosine-5)-methyltransferase 1